MSTPEQDRRYYDLLDAKRKREGLPPVTPGAGRTSALSHGTRAMAGSAPEKDGTFVLPPGTDVTLDCIDPAVMAQIDTAAAKLDTSARWVDDPAPKPLSDHEARAQKVNEVFFGQLKPRDEIQEPISAVVGEEVPCYAPAEWYQPPVLESDR